MPHNQLGMEGKAAPEGRWRGLKISAVSRCAVEKGRDCVSASEFRQSFVEKKKKKEVEKRDGGLRF